MAESASCNFIMMSLLSLFSVETTTTIDISREDTVVRLNRKTFCGPNSTNSREEKSTVEVRRGAEYATRRISEKNSTTTAEANLAYVITLASKCITKRLCIGPTLKMTKTTHL